MSLIARPRWTRQPQGPVQIDWSNPLTRGLQSLWRFDQLLDVRTNKRFAITETTGMTPSSPSLCGKGVKRTTVTTNLGYIDLNAALTSDFTLVALHVPSSLANPGELLDDDDFPRRLQFRAGSTGNTEFIFFNTAGSAFTASSSGIQVNSVCISAATKLGSTITAYTDGVPGTPVTVTGTPQSGTTTVRAFVGRNGGDNYQGTQVFSAWFNRALSDGEIKSISANPWQIFKPVTRTIALSGAVVQLLRPDGDISSGAWLPSTGSDLYAMLDETTADDGDYIYTTSTSTAEVSLTNAGDPAVSTGHIIRYRAKGTGTLTVKLMQGTTTIATHVPTLTTSYQTFSFTLSGAEADSITDYNNLRLQFVSS